MGTRICNDDQAHLNILKDEEALAKIANTWFGFTPDADNWANRIAPGTGVPDMAGYDETPVTPKCD